MRKAEREGNSIDSQQQLASSGLLLFNLANSQEFIDRYDCIIIDEMHERNKEQVSTEKVTTAAFCIFSCPCTGVSNHERLRDYVQDLCLSLLRDYLLKSKSSNPSFKLVVMSASIDASIFCEYLWNCPTIDCPGRLHPVEDIYWSAEESTNGFTDVTSHALEVLFEQIVEGAKEMTGDVLIFLSGASDIDACVAKIRARAKETGALVVAYPLYSRLNPDHISLATDPNHRSGIHGEMAMGKSGGEMQKQVRKVVCTTNMAETSLTIDGVRFVIESGRANKVKYNHTLRCPVLSEDWISRASAIQRRGRAGRTNSGRCYYLYSEEFHETEMKAYDNPKIQEAPVDALILFSMHVCGKSVEEMGLLDPPKPEDIDNAKERLTDLGFLEMTEGRLSLTTDGKVACTLPMMRPESVRMILVACSKYPGAATRAMILGMIISSMESILDGNADVHDEDNLRHVYGDHLLALQWFEWFDAASKKLKKSKLKQKCDDRGLNFRVLSAIREDVEKCHQELKKQKLVPSVAGECDSDIILLRTLVSGFFHQIVRCVEPDYSTKTKGTSLTIPDLSLCLDRGSHLEKTLAAKRNASSFVEDSQHDTDNECMNDSVASDGGLEHSPEYLSGEGFSIVREEVAPYFILYGNLKSNSKGMTFMLDASAIEGPCLLEEAPERWRKRVQFDPQLQNNCRLIIRNTGPKILGECKKVGSSGDFDFFERIANTFHVDEVVVSMERRLVVVNGTQTAVDNAVYEIKKALVSLKQEFRRNDKAHNSALDLRFGAGMRVNGPFQRSNANQQFHSRFKAFGTNEDDYSRAGFVMNVYVDGRNCSLSCSPVRGFSKALVKQALEKVSGVKVKAEKQRLLIMFQSKGRHCWHDSAKKIAANLRHHEALASVTVRCPDFSKAKQATVARALCQEAQYGSSFWQVFRADLLSGGQKDAGLCFVPSHGSFAFGPANEKLALAFRGRVAALATSSMYDEVELELVFERYKARRFASCLAELRKRHPKVLFRIVEVRDEDEGKTKNDGLSDYEWLMQLAKSKMMIKTIRLCTSSLNKKDHAKARESLSDYLSSKAMEMSPILDGPTPRNCERRYCAMCRRAVLVVFGKKPSEVKINKSLLGWSLTLCGCCYCRECFYNGVTESLKDEGVAKCLCCKNEILAKDCSLIIDGSKLTGDKESAVGSSCDETSKKTGNKEITVASSRKEWNHVCHLAEASYCRMNESLLTQGTKLGPNRTRQSGWATCPDCSFSMVHPGGYLFFICRNTNCRSKICTRCYQVVVSDEDGKRCATNKCTPRDTGC